MSIDRLRTPVTRRIARRDLMQQLSAVGFALGARAFPAVAQEKTSTPQPALAETLARYAVNLKYEDIPGDVVRIAKRTILDTIGCAFGGYTAGPSRIAIQLASEATSKRPA